MTELVWAAVALITVGLTYDVLRRSIVGARKQDSDALAKRCDALTERLTEHERLFTDICLQWRGKVEELERKCDNVVRDANNEIAGSLAAVSDITRKGWR